MNTTSKLAPRQLALITGLSIVGMAIVAGITFGYMHSSLVVESNIEATFNKLQENSQLFKGELFGWGLIFILDAIVAWALYYFLSPVSKTLSFLSSFLRVAYTAVLGLAIFNLSKVLELIDKQFTAIGLSELKLQAWEHISSFEDIWSKGLIIFGLHLIVLGYLAFKANYVPKIWGILLMLAGLSYFYLNAMYYFFPQTKESLTVVESILSIPMTIGEVGFAIWLIARGGKKS